MCVHEILMTTTVFGDRKKSKHTSKKSDPVKKATSRKKSDIHLKNDQKSEKKQNDEFSHEKSKTGRFIYGPLFLPGALGGAFYPIYGTMVWENSILFCFFLRGIFGWLVQRTCENCGTSTIDTC